LPKNANRQCRKHRLASLYSDFSYQEHTNPDGYRANLEAWRRALVAAAREGVLPTEHGSKDHDRLVIHTGDDLAAALDTRDWGVPSGLGRVVVRVS
jgi:charged multivesicular body protein 7